MDLIFTNANRVDQGVLHSYSFDLSFGEKENDFEIVLGGDEARLEYGAFVYIEGTEYGGIVDAMKASTIAEDITYTGRTWHGMLNSKVIRPDTGEDYLIVSGEANSILATLLNRLGLTGFFVASENDSGIEIEEYQFKRYCMGYEGITAMLSENGAKLKLVWKNRVVHLSAVPVVDYTEAPVDGDVARLNVLQHGKKVNHLVCLGRGELAERQIVDLYVDKDGNIVDKQYFTGIDEYAKTYENTSAESLKDLKKTGKEQLKKLLDVDAAEISIVESNELVYDIGDIVSATDAERTRMTVSAKVAQKIVRINNGLISTEYQTGSE